MAGPLPHGQLGEILVVAGHVDQCSDSVVGGAPLAVPDALIGIVAFQVDQHAQSVPVTDALAENAAGVTVVPLSIDQHSHTTR